MHTSRYSFFLLQIFGLWRPSCWPENSWKTKLYKIHTVFLSFLISTIIVCEFVYLLSTIQDIEAFAHNSFILLTMIAMCGKAINILKRRYRIIGLTCILTNEICRPRNIEETMIQQRFDESVRWTTLLYGTLAGATAIAMLVAPTLQNPTQKELPFSTWLPWNYRTDMGWWLAYAYQILAHGAGAMINIACDTLLAGLMVQTCAQFRILKCRFVSMPKLIEDKLRTQMGMDKRIINIEYLEKKVLKKYIMHHLEILNYGKTLNAIFEEIIFLQFAISTLVLCVSVYQLSILILFSPEFMSTVLYLLCMLIQIFGFCYYGSELAFESSNMGDEIYKMDWDPLSTNTKKSLITIMASTLKPMKYTSGRVIILNLDSFVTLVKLSYSAFNLLQQSSK